MKDWAKAEEIVRQMSGGKITPGSGNQRIKGDVRVGRTAIIEVKQTEATVISLQREWLDKLERESAAEQLILAIFFELRGHTYWWVDDNDDENWEPWSSLTVKEGCLPDELRTASSIWELQPLSSLRDLRT